MEKLLKRVEVVFPCHNRRKLTLQCLKSLARIDRTGIDVHVVVVDDGSTDGTSDAIQEEFPDAEIIVGDGNLWFTEGTNVGIRAALNHEPDYVLLINDDQVFDSNAIRSMVECAERHPRSVVGSLLLLWDTPHKLFQTAPVWRTRLGGWRHWHSQTLWTIPKSPWKVDIIVGNCVLVPAGAIAEAGLMNSKRYPNFGDAEYTPRLRKLGWTLLIEPRARVFCQPNNLPPRIKAMGLRKMFSALFVDLGNVHNLRRRLYANLDSAPSKLQGLAAFTMFMFGAVSDGGTERMNSENSAAEPPLSETFSSAVIVE